MMMMIFYAGVLAAAALASTSDNAAAQGADSDGASAQHDLLTLDEAQAEARSHSVDAAELRARVGAARVLLPATQRIFRADPVLAAGVESGAPFGQLEEGALNASVSWTIDPTASWVPRGAAGAGEVTRAEREQADGLLALDEAVAVTVAEVARAQRTVKRAERMAELRGQLSEAAHKQLEVGQGNQPDVDAADLDFAGARSARVTALAALDATRARLARVLGRETGSGIVVEDPSQPPSSGPPLLGEALAAAVERNARALAAAADLEAARRAAESEERLFWPQPTLGVAYSFQRREIPEGAFASNGDLSAAWSDHELGVSVSVPLPLFDGNTDARAKAASRVLAAEARLRVIKADVAAELSARMFELRGALAAYAELAASQEIIEREYQLQSEAVRAGAGDVVSRSLAFARLESAGERLDDAVFGVRVARARWARNIAGGNGPLGPQKTLRGDDRGVHE